MLLCQDRFLSKNWLVSTNTNPMKCFVDWTPIRIRLCIKIARCIMIFRTLDLYWISNESNFTEFQLRSWNALGGVQTGNARQHKNLFSSEFQMVFRRRLHEHPLTAEEEVRTHWDRATEDWTHICQHESMWAMTRWVKALQHGTWTDKGGFNTCWHASRTRKKRKQPSIFLPHISNGLHAETGYGEFIWAMYLSNVFERQTDPMEANETFGDSYQRIYANSQSADQ